MSKRVTIMMRSGDNHIYNGASDSIAGEIETGWGNRQEHFSITTSNPKTAAFFFKKHVECIKVEEESE
ncbi:hypothetical protein [Bacillus pumilus]|uniref:hypothetical protein n=1 Tax=Bacillus pumilus TaxID=1408 RepID=UPI0033062454